MELRSPLLIIIGIVLLLAVAGVAFFLTRGAPDRATGEATVVARSRVLEITKTGVNRGPNVPLMHLRLEVTPPQGSSYVVETDQGIHVADLPRYQQGAQVEVRIDPQRPDRVRLIP